MYVCFGFSWLTWLSFYFIFFKYCILIGGLFDLLESSSVSAHEWITMIEFNNAFFSSLAQQNPVRLLVCVWLAGRLDQSVCLSVRPSVWPSFAVAAWIKHFVPLNTISKKSFKLWYVGIIEWFSPGGYPVIHTYIYIVWYVAMRLNAQNNSRILINQARPIVEHSSMMVLSLFLKNLLVSEIRWQFRHSISECQRGVNPAEINNENRREIRGSLVKKN